jgi:hypothetical protein
MRGDGKFIVGGNWKCVRWLRIGPQGFIAGAVARLRHARRALLRAATRGNRAVWRGARRCTLDRARRRPRRCGRAARRERRAVGAMPATLPPPRRA